MSLSEYVVGLFSHPDELADEGSPEAGGDARIGGAVAVVYECRRCGTTVTARTVRCPNCEKPSIAEYVVE